MVRMDANFNALSRSWLPKRAALSSASSKSLKKRLLWRIRVVSDDGREEGVS